MITSTYLVLGSVPHKLITIIPGDRHTDLENVKFDCPFELTALAEISGSENLISHMSELFPTDLQDGWYYFTREIAEELQLILSEVEERYLVSASGSASELSDADRGYVSEFDLDNCDPTVPDDFPSVVDLPVGSVVVRNNVVYELIYVDGFREVIPVWVPMDS